MKKEPVRYDESDGTIYIAKERGEISLPKGNWVIREDNTDGCFWSIDPDNFFANIQSCKRNSKYLYKKGI
jgi:hypothetical protein